MPPMFRIELRTVWWIISGLFFAGGVVQLFIGNLLFMEVLDLVNERLPNESQISQIGANRRAFEILKLYRQLYPHGSLRTKATRFLIGGFLCFGAATLIAFLNG